MTKTFSKSQISKLIAEVEYFEVQGFKPIGRPDLSSMRIECPFDWSANPYNDNNWKFQLHTLRYLMIYLSAYIATKDDVYAEKLSAFIQDWYNFDCKHSADFAWNDMAAGIRAEKLHLVFSAFKEKKFDWGWDIKGLVKKHIDLMSAPGFINVNHNHGLYALHGLRCIAELSGPKKREIIREYCEKKIEEVICNQFDENYMHREHSPHYHVLSLDMLKKLLKSGMYDGSELLKNTLSGAESVSKFMYLPDGREVPFGDTDNSVKEKSRSPDKQKDILSNYEMFNRSGYFYLGNHSTHSFLCMTNSYNSNIHKHADNMSMIWGEAGRDILADPGKYKYCNDQIRTDILSSSCHSVANFNDKCWTLRDIKRPLEDINVNRYENHIKLNSALKLKDKFNWRRNIQYAPHNYLIVTDTLNNQTPEGYQSKFILDKGVQVIKLDNELLLKVGGLVYKCWAWVDDIYDKTVVPIVTKCPISYSYGTHETTQALLVEYTERSSFIFQLYSESSVTSFDLLKNITVNQL